MVEELTLVVEGKPDSGFVVKSADEGMAAKKLDE